MVKHEPATEHSEAQDTLRTKPQRKSRWQVAGFHEAAKKYSAPIVLDEVKALIHYVSERGLDPDALILVPLNQAIVQYESANTQKEEDQAASDILKYYSKLSELTYPTNGVNGRTILNGYWVVLNMAFIIFWGAVFFICATGTEILGLWLEGRPEPEVSFSLVDWHRYVLSYLSPLFWGGLGACVSLAKKLSDLAAQQKFDKLRLQGYGTRIWLGAVIGSAFVYLFYDAATVREALNLQPKAVAFLSGLGVKAIYGAFETMVQIVSDKVKGWRTNEKPTPAGAAPKPAGP